MRLRNRVRVMRETAGLSQVELARKAGISRATLSYIEQDNGHQPRTRQVTALASALGDPALFWWEAATDEPAEATA